MNAMERLWAPWRSAYITGSQDKNAGCIFCEDSDYLVAKTPLSIAILNKYPYNNGHILIAPIRHTGDLTALEDNELLDIMNLAKRVMGALSRRLKPEGYNVGFNIGKAAGAGITDHIHLHIVPRWNGDTNFMPVLSDVKVISQSLDELRRILSEELQ